MNARAHPSSLATRWLREPVLHFLLIGGALFALYGALNPQPSQRGQANRIEISDEDLRQLRTAWAAQWQRPPTPEELGSLVVAKVREEILYREALALGLDRGDTIVRRRLAQKMEFLADDLSGARDPDAAELKAWFARNGERFAQPGRVSFRHVYFSPDRQGTPARAAAVTTLEQRASALDGPAASVGGDRFMFEDRYADRSPEEVAAVFGSGFAQSLFQLKPGTWQGPFESGLGWHLVKLESITPGRIPAFDEVESEVKALWLSEQRVEARKRVFEVMRARYDVVLPGGAS